MRHFLLSFALIAFGSASVVLAQQDEGQSVINIKVAVDGAVNNARRKQ